MAEQRQEPLTESIMRLRGSNEGAGAGELCFVRDGCLGRMVAKVVLATVIGCE